MIDFLLIVAGVTCLAGVAIGLVHWWRQEPRLRPREQFEAPDNDSLGMLLEVATHHRADDVGSGHDSGYASDVGSDGSDSGGDGGGGGD